MYKSTILQDRTLEYSLRKSIRARNLRVAVYCDASVVVTAPVYLSDSKIEKFLNSKAAWIISKVDNFLKSGKTVRLSGGKREYKKYCEQSRRLVEEKIKKVNEFYGFSFGRVSIKNHKTRWGSCSKKGNLNFNYKIIFLPDSLAEYIVAHELCHLQEFNHGHNFWELLGKFIPDYRDCRRKLRQHIF